MVSLASFGAIVVFINPYNAGWFNLALFSAVVFMLVFSLCSGLGFWARKKFITERNLNRILKMAFRQGGLVALLLVSYLWLSHFEVLKLWTTIPVLLLIVGIEYYFLTCHEYHNQITGS